MLQAFVGASDLKAACQADGFEYGGVDYRHRFAQGVIEPRLISAERSVAVEQPETGRGTRRGLHRRRLGSGFLSFERIYCYSSFHDSRPPGRHLLMASAKSRPLRARALWRRNSAHRPWRGRIPFSEHRVRQCYPICRGKIPEGSPCMTARKDAPLLEGIRNAADAVYNVVLRARHGTCRGGGYIRESSRRRGLL